MAMTLEEVMLQRRKAPTNLGVYGNPSRDALVEELGSELEKDYRGSEITSLQQQIITEARKRNISPAHALAMFEQESSFNPYVGKSTAGAAGLGQMTESTAKSRGVDYARLSTDPAYSVQTSLDYLRDLSKQQKGDIEQALQSYYGRGNQAAGGNPNYVRDVLARVPRMQKIVEANPPPEPRGLERIGENLYQSGQAEIAGQIGTGEAALSLTTGLAGGAVGVAAFALGATFAPVANPANRDKYYQMLTETAREVGGKLTYEPRTEVGKLLMQAPNAAMEVLGKISEGASESIIPRLLLTPDQRYALRYVHELATIAAISEPVAAALRPVMPKLEMFRQQFSELPADTPPSPRQRARLLSLAEGITRTTQETPKIVTELQAARQRLAGTLQAYYEKGVAESPELPFPIPTQGELALRLPRLPEVPTGPTPTRATGQGELPLIGEGGLFTPRNKLPGEFAVMTPDEYLAATGRTRRDVDFRTFISDEFLPIVQQAFEGGLVPQGVRDPVLRKQYVENLRGALASANYAPMSLEGIRGDIVRALDPNSTGETRQQLLRDIKARVREGSKPNEPIRTSLERLGMTVDEIAEIEGPLKNVRAQRTPLSERPVQPEDLAGAKPPISEIESTTRPVVERVTEPAVQTFSTALGSGYELYADNTTQRVKAPRPEHPGDFGVQPRSAHTYFVDYADALKLGEIQTHGAGRREIAETPDGRIGVRYLEGKDAGKFERRTMARPKDGPEIGLTPIEIMPDGGVHFGNKIVAVGVDTTPAIKKPKRAPRQKKVIEVKEPVITEPTVPPTITPPTVTEVVLPIIEKQAPLVTYESAKTTTTTLALVESRMRPTAPSTEPQSTTLQVRYANDVPDAIMYNDSGLNTRTSLAQIRRDVERGRMSPDVAQALENGLRRQSELFGVPVDTAHNYTAAELLQQVMQLAKDKGLELYRAEKTKTGTKYTQVPAEVIDSTLRLDTRNPLEPSGVSVENAAAYIEDKTLPVGRATIDEIMQALETGTDISDRLPENVRQHFKDMLEQHRKGMNTNEARSFVDILKDVADVISPPDIIPPTQLGAITPGALAIFGLTPMRKAAAQRLWADATKKRVSFDRVLDEARIPESEKVLFKQLIASQRNPLPPEGVEPAYMQLDPTRTNDRVVSQRVEIRKDANGADELVAFAPIYASEVGMLQNARQFSGVQGLSKVGTAELGKHSLLEPYFALRRAGVLQLHYAARASERAAVRELASVDADLNALAKVHDKTSRERIGEFGYGESLQGMNILIKNGRDIPSLNRNEQITRDAQRRFYEDTFERTNDVREATGRERLHYEENYIPFMRVFSMAERLGQQLNLILDSPEHIRAVYDNLSKLDFPREKRRTGARYSAEFDSFTLMHDYARQITKQIHMAPFLDKLKEMVTQPLPEPATGKSTWLLKDNNPQLHRYLVDWHESITHGTQPTFAPGIDKAATTLMNNISGATIGLTLKSAVAQFGALRNVAHTTGWPHLINGTLETMGDALTYFFRPENTRAHKAFLSSDMLDTRGVQDIYTDVSASLIGGRPRDFMQAIKDGRYRELLHEFDQSVSYKLLSAMDMTTALITHNAARRLAEQINREGVKRGIAEVLDSTRTKQFIDDVLIRTNGSSMAVDVAPIQRTTGGRLATQFQRFLINDWNYLIEDVFGAAGRKDIARLLARDPDKYLPAFVKSTIMFVAATTAFNTIYESLGFNSIFPSPLKALNQSMDAGDNVLKTATKVALELATDVPIVGRSRYGQIGPPVLSVLGEATQSLLGSRGAYKLAKPDDTVLEGVARAYGSPVARFLGARGSSQVGRAVRGEDRGQAFWPSITGLYEPPQPNVGIRELRRPGEGIVRIR